LACAALDSCRGWRVRRTRVGVGFSVSGRDCPLRSN
jgi:hypothetical protein